MSRIAGLVLAMALAAAPVYGEATVEWMERVSTEGDHNAFTDLVKWKGMYYLCYRHGEGHVSMDGEIHVLRSPDMRAWEPAGIVRTLGDDRDPHFTATPDRLFLYFGTWDLRHSEGDGPPERWRVRSHVAHTNTGTDWSKVKALYEPEFWMWRVRYFDGVFYSAAYTAVRPTPSFRETRLLRSEDGLTWQYVSTVTNEHMAGESDFWLEADGSMSLITRTEGNAYYYRSDPALAEWRGTPLSGMVHAPVTVPWKGGRIVAGRDRDGERSVTRLWNFRDGVLSPLLTLPSGGDTSYAGLLLEKHEGRTNPALYVSWYSQFIPELEESGGRHEAHVYVAEIGLE